MFGRSTSNFDRLLEKATSQLLLEPDWTSIMMICDSIRQGDTNPKYAVAAVKKKFYHSNPHVALYALQVMESCVKNCGVLVHEEIATKAFMEELRDLVKQSTDEHTKTKVLELLQTWGSAFRGSPKYRIVTDTLNLMKAEGWKFPPVREAEAMFEADTAPEWVEGEVCNRCRVGFGTFTRQHHCRACGQVFCGKCSAKVCVLPKFGIEREVRVCDSCFDTYGAKDGEDTSVISPSGQGGKGRSVDKEGSESLPAEYLASPLSKQPQEPPAKQVGGKTEAEIKEEEELQLVLALSKSEAEEKEAAKKKATSDMLAGFSNGTTESGSHSNGAREPDRPREDPELEKYLNREYWEQQSRSTAKSLVLTSPSQDQEQVQTSPPALTTDKTENEELDEFTTSLRTQLEIFVNRMKSNSSRGRPIATDSSVQTLFMNVMTMHGKLVRYIQEQEEERVMYEALQDKLAQVKDARAALDALREEEAERKRAEQEEAERQRQIQLAAKLDVMRKKKAEYLEYQRQVAMQRMADQEREHNKVPAYMPPPHGMYNMYLPYAGNFHPQQYPGMPQYPHYQPGMPPQPAMGLGMAPQQPGMVSQQPGMAPQQPGMAPQQPGMAPQQPGMAPPVSGMAPPVSGMAPPVSGMAPPVSGMAPPVSGMAPQVTGIAPPVSGMTPPVSGMAPPVSGMAPQQSQPPNMAPQQPGMAPQQSGMLTHQPGMAPQQPGMVPQQPGMGPQSGLNSPGMTTAQSMPLQPVQGNNPASIHPRHMFPPYYPPQANPDTYSMAGLVHALPHQGYTEQAQPGAPHMQTQPGAPHMQVQPGAPHMQTNSGAPHMQTQPGASLMQAQPGAPHLSTQPGVAHMQTQPGAPYIQTQPGDTHIQPQPGAPEQSLICFD